MAEYTKIAQNHNNAAGLARFDTDPWVARVNPGIFRISLSLKVYQDGDQSVELRWLPKVPNSVKTDALSKCGLTSAVYANVTIRLPSNKDRSSYANYNGIATYLQEDEYERRGSGFTILVFNLTAI